jgi:hypothetical protein
MSNWTSDDLFFLEAAYTGRMTLPDTARMLRKPEDEVRLKAMEQGFAESPSTVPDKTDSVRARKAPALSD